MIFSCNNSTPSLNNRKRQQSNSSTPLSNFVAIPANYFRAVNWMNRIDWLSSIEQLELAFVTTDLNN